MKRKHWFLMMAGLVAGFFVSGRYAILAQDRTQQPRASSRAAPTEKPGESSNVSVNLDVPDERQQASRTVKDIPNNVTIQEALLRPYHFPFSQPTSLERFCSHLRETLKGSVVLDLAALGRKSVEPQDTVQLELDGVRLKTGLKLLLDQVGLTYHVVAEDNLMIITDQEGSEDPADRIWAELRALHRDLHAVQDAFDDLRPCWELKEKARTCESRPLLRRCPSKLERSRESDQRNQGVPVINRKGPGRLFRGHARCRCVFPLRVRRRRL